MKIAHFNTLLTGGAAIAARRLHDSLLPEGVCSRFYYKMGEGNSSSYEQLPAAVPGFGLMENFRRLCSRSAEQQRQSAMQGRPDWLERFSPSRCTYRPSDSWKTFQPDIIHLHWVADFIDYPSFFAAIPDTKPIVWTLHDMNPFTGGCHYSWECDLYKKGCGNCFQLGNPSPNDLSAVNLRLKYKVLHRKNLHVVANSYWIEDEARSSLIFSKAKSIQTIHYGLDTTRFKPRLQAEAKRALGLDQGTPVVAFGAVGVDNRRKGIEILLRALQLVDFNVNLLVFGHGALDIPSGRIKIVSVGSVESELLLSNIYSAADLFVIPSLYEAFGQTCLEAMACGTPVIGFDTGGIPDMIKDFETGLLAVRGDAEDLAAKIRYLLTWPEKGREMGVNARAMVENDFTLGNQADNYQKLYRRILS